MPAPAAPELPTHPPYTPRHRPNARRASKLYTIPQFFVWLGKKNRTAASKRTASPILKGGKTPVSRFNDALCPWNVTQYPGRHRFLASVLGVSLVSAKRFQQPSANVSPAHDAKLAAYLRTKAATLLALAAELEASAEAKRRALKRPPKDV